MLAPQVNPLLSKALVQALYSHEGDVELGTQHNKGHRLLAV